MPRHCGNSPTIRGQNRSPHNVKSLNFRVKTCFQVKVRVRVGVRQVVVRIRVTLQGMSQCNVLKSHENTTVCVCVARRNRLQECLA